MSINLQDLPRAHCPHIYDPLEGATPEQRIEIARITGIVSVRGEMITPAMLQQAAAEQAATGAKLCVRWTPWRDKREWDAEVFAIDDLADRLGSVVPDYLYLDSEVWRYDQVVDSWLRERLDFSDGLLRERFPTAKIIWYGRSVQYHSSKGWIRSYWWTGKERTDYLTPSLYNPSEPQLCRELYERTRTRWLGIKMCPFISLGCGYERTAGDSVSYKWLSELNYPLAWDYAQGAWLRKQGVELVGLYPQPLLARYPRYMECFATYLDGMNGNQFTNEVEK